MKNKLVSVLKNILSMLVFWTIACGISYFTYYLTLREVYDLKWTQLFGFYLMLLQLVILVMVTMKNDK